MNEESPRLSSNDLTLYFGRSGDIYKSIRTTTSSPWQAATPVNELNTGAYEKWADVCSTGYAIVSREVASNGQNLFEGTITTNANTALTVFNTANNEQGTLLSADCLHIYFQSDRDGNFDIFEASRTTTGTAWSNPTKLNDFNTATFGEEDPWTSTDGRVFVYASNALGTKDLYISTR
jgi:Tol biopolymer transport system component